VHEINIFAFVMVVQSLPFLAAAALAAIEDTRFNSFAYWRGIEARIEAAIGTKAADLLPQRDAVTSAVTSAVTNVMTSAVAEPPKLPADTAEPAQ
jgi:uncharacterized membrane-anchored protein